MERAGMTLYSTDADGRPAFQHYPAIELRKPNPKTEFTVYGRTPCEYSREAYDALIKLVKRKKIRSFAYWNVTDPVLRQDARKLAPERHKTVPIVFHEGVFLGGNEELQKFLNDTGKFLDDPDMKIYM